MYGQGDLRDVFVMSYEGVLGLDLLPLIATCCREEARRLDIDLLLLSI